MVGIIKNLFGGKDKYYAELDEDQAAASDNQQPAPSPQETEQPKAEAATTQSQSAPAPVPQTQTTENDQLSGDTFAPTYLIPKPTIPRRRPGVNMSQFIDMARDMPTPRNQ